jgi:hypothetical protein
VSYEVHATVTHCKRCTGKQPEIVMPLAKSAVVQCTRCQTIHSGGAFPRALVTRSHSDEP